MTRWRSRFVFVALLALPLFAGGLVQAQDVETARASSELSAGEIMVSRPDFVNELLTLGLDLLGGNGGPCYKYLIGVAQLCYEDIEVAVQSYLDISELRRNVGAILEGTAGGQNSSTDEWRRVETSADEQQENDLQPQSVQEKDFFPDDNMHLVMEYASLIQSLKVLQGQNISAKEALSLHDNVTVYDMILADITITTSCCSGLQQLKERGCLCDQGSLGTFLDMAWKELDSYWKELVVLVAGDECGITFPDNATQAVDVSDLDPSNRCECRKQFAVLERQKGKELRAQMRMSQELPVSSFDSAMEFDDLTEARQFFTDQKLDELDVDNDTASEIRDLCA